MQQSQISETRWILMLSVHYYGRLGAMRTEPIWELTDRRHLEPNVLLRWLCDLTACVSAQLGSYNSLGCPIVLLCERSLVFTFVLLAIRD
jgi:hypothetical protein